MRRSDQRRDAAFAIYQRDVTTRTLEQLLVDAKPFTRALAEGTEENLAALDAEISAHSRGWTIERIAPLEKAIMRVALFEIHHCEETPDPVAIDEAVTITKRYCGAEAPGFVNGILSASARGRAASNGAVPSPAPGGRMSSALDSLRAAAERLDAIARELADPETSDSRSVELAKEAAELAGEAGTAASEAVRAAAASGESG